MIPHTPWRAEFDECGGYDCMTGAWEIRDSQNRLVVSVDQANFGQKNCDYAFRSEEAKAIAEFIVEQVNKKEQHETQDDVCKDGGVFQDSGY